MQSCSIRLDPTLRNCFVDVSDRIGDALGLRYSGECLRIVSSSNRTSYLTWSGRRGATSLRLSTELAKCLALKDGEVVRVSKAFGVVEAKNVEIEPVSSDDWEMIELNGGHLERNLLGQISLVWSNAVLPIWIRNACVRVRVKTNSSGDRPLRLTRDVTQLLVVPKPRDKIEDVKGGEDEEFEDPIVHARVTMNRADPMDRVIRISSLVADAMKLKRHELNDVVVAVWPRRRRKKKNTDGKEEEDFYFLDFMRVVIDPRLRYMHVSVPKHVRHRLDIAIYTSVCMRRVRRESDVATVRNVRCFSLSDESRIESVDVEELKNEFKTFWQDTVVTSRSKSLCRWKLGRNREEERKEEEEETLPYGGNIQEAMKKQDREAIRVLLKARNRISGVSRKETSSRKVQETVRVEIEWNVDEINTASRKKLSSSLRYVNLTSERALRALRNWFRDQKISNLRVFNSNEIKDDLHWTCLTKKQYPTLKDVFRLGLNDVVETVQCHLQSTIVGEYAKARVLKKLPTSGGVYIHGKSGVGKTTFVRAFARHMQLEHECAIVWIDCEELSQNQATSTLKRAFRVARRSAPSIIVLDGLDKIAPPAESASGEDSVGGNNTNTLLAKHCVEILSDLAVSQQVASDEHMFRIRNNHVERLEMESIRTGVSMIATGLNSKSISNVLRRGGILDLQVEIQDPGPERREVILRELLRSRGGTVDCSESAIKFMSIETDSYTASDLTLLLERVVHVFTSKKKKKKRIEENDVRDALDGFVPVALRGLKLVQSKTTWDDVGGLSDVCRILRDTLELPLRYPEFFRNAPIRLPAGVLLYGPPGCGKTLVAGAAAGQCGLNFLSVKGPELLDKYIGASEAAVRALFARAQAASPCVLFFDEFEATAPKRGSDGTGVTDRVVNQLLTFLDGVEDRTGVYVLAATSRPDMIDAALLRPGRLDTAVECGFPEPKERVSILHVVSRGYDLSSESSKRLEDIMLSSRTNGWSGADIKALLTTAHLTALRGNSGSIELKDIEHALTDVRPSVPLEERRRYARIYARFKGSRAADFPMTEAGDEGGLKQRTALK